MMTPTAIKHKMVDNNPGLSLNLSSMNEDPGIYQHIKKGDESAFEALFRKYYERLCSYVYQYTGNMSDAEEMVQETFLGIWEKRRDLHITTSLKSYLYQTVKNKALNNIRNTRRRRGHLEIIKNSSQRISDAEDEISANDLKDHLYEGLECLPPKCRKIFQMSRLEGLKHKEIAVKMGIKPKTVENQIGIALKNLRIFLADYLEIIVLFLTTINF